MVVHEHFNNTHVDKDPDPERSSVELRYSTLDWKRYDTFASSDGANHELGLPEHRPRFTTGHQDAKVPPKRLRPLLVDKSFGRCVLGEYGERVDGHASN